jgi:hypothetical protein
MTASYLIVARQRPETLAIDLHDPAQAVSRDGASSHAEKDRFSRLSYSI